MDLPGSALDRHECLGCAQCGYIHCDGEPLNRFIIHRKGTEVMGYEAPFLRLDTRKV